MSVMLSRHTQIYQKANANAYVYGSSHDIMIHIFSLQRLSVVNWHTAHILIRNNGKRAV